MNIVVDASIVIKMYVPELLSEKTEQILTGVEKGDIFLLAPDLIYPEVGNTLWKKQRFKELTPAEVKKITDSIIALPIRTEFSRSLLLLAVDTALTCNITVYDSMYLTLAMIYETKMITADRKLSSVIEKTRFKNYITWLSDYISH